MRKKKINIIELIKPLSSFSPRLGGNEQKAVDYFDIIIIIPNDSRIGMYNL